MLEDLKKAESPKKNCLQFFEIIEREYFERTEKLMEVKLNGKHAYSYDVLLYGKVSRDTHLALRLKSNGA